MAAREGHSLQVEAAPPSQEKKGKNQPNSANMWILTEDAFPLYAPSYQKFPGATAGVHRNILTVVHGKISKHTCAIKITGSFYGCHLMTP